MNDSTRTAGGERAGGAEEPTSPERHRLDHLLGMHVVFPDGRTGDQVTDVRLACGDPGDGTLGDPVVDGFVIGRRRPGTYFGYDRHPTMCPGSCGSSSAACTDTPAS